MSRREYRRAVELAEKKLDHEQRRWQLRTFALREHVQRYRLAWLLGGGLGAGFVTGLIPWRTGANLGRLAMSLSTVLLRSPLGLSMVQSARRRITRND